jgi:hypothetical protein
MALIRRKRLTNADIEKTVLTGLITSTRVLEAVQPIADPNLFVLDVSRIIAKWCFDYYEVYKKPPAESLEAIYLAEKSSLKESDQQLVSEFLRTLSREFTTNPPNEEYIANQAKDFFVRQKLLNMSKEMQGILELGGPTVKVEALISTYQQFNTNGISIAQDMFSPTFINSIFDSQETPLMEFSGALGRFIGPLHRGYLFGIMGPMKRGKTTWLMRFAKQAMLQRLKVAFISLEMTAEQLGLRFLQHLESLGKPSKIEEQEYVIPAMDCQLNQENNCNRSIRECRTAMPEAEFVSGQEYKPCSACRYQTNNSFSPRIYYVKEMRPSLSRALIRSMNEQFLIQFGPNALQLLGFPAYSATLKDIESELNVLEFKGFIPDVIIIDYPDILAPEDLRADKLEQINQTWMSLKALSQVRRCLVFAPTQGSRQSFKKPLIDPTDVPWDIRKLAHVDLMIGLNQTNYEKKDLITRLNIIVHRWEEFHPNRVYVALQQLKLAQPELDGHIKMFNG